MLLSSLSECSRSKETSNRRKTEYLAFSISVFPSSRGEEIDNALKKKKGGTLSSLSQEMQNINQIQYCWSHNMIEAARIYRQRFFKMI